MRTLKNKTKTKTKHTTNCLEAHQGVGKFEGFTCTDNCENKPQHTPTPGFTQKELTYIAKNGMTFKVSGSRKDEGDFIVRAVNSHEALLKAAKSIMKGFKQEGGFWVSDSPLCYNSQGALDMLFEAIAQAEGK